MDAATATLIASTFGTLAVSVLNYMRENRAHRWAEEAHEEDKQERAQAAQSLHAKIDDAQHDIAAAYEVANNVNDKLVAIGDVRTMKGQEQQQRRKDDHA